MWMSEIKAQKLGGFVFSDVQKFSQKFNSLKSVQ
jgi:hypothetical protein